MDSKLIKGDPRDWEEIRRLIKEQSGGLADFEYNNLEIESKNSGINRRVSTKSGLSAYSGDWNDSAIAHLLKRSLFGVKPADLELFKQLNVSDAVDQLIQNSPQPSAPVNNYSDQDPDVPFGQSWHEAPYNNEFEYQRIMSLNAWTIDNFLNQEHTIHEKMILFWHNLLPTQAVGVFIGKASYQYFDMLRRNALGNYKTMIKELTLDPCMLFYLNGASNNKYAPDENYSRELQELFTVGKGPNSGYNEADVQAGARLLTGFRAKWDDIFKSGSLEPFFEEGWHDTDDKQFSEFYGNKVIVGRSGQQGADELDDMLDMIFETNEVALYICRRLYNFFVYSEVDENAEQNVIVPLAQIFRDSNYDIVPVLKALFTSEHFFDESNRGALIKSPIEQFYGFWRTTGMQHMDPDDIHLKYNTMNNIYWTYLNGTGMKIGDPPSVSGWPAYYQAPVFDKSWITTDSITRRIQYIDALIYGWINISGNRLQVDLIQFVEQLAQPGDSELLVRDLSVLLLGSSPSDESVEYVKSVLLTGQDNPLYWTYAWDDYQLHPEDEEKRQVVETRLQRMFQALCQLGEFQLM